MLEKIAPENKVMTSVTHFTADTKENRESVYLYDILHDIIRARVQDTNCLSCEYAASCGVPTKDIRDLLSLHTKIRYGDLSDVPAEKQALQNNKLMCDKNYKMVWDAVKRLSQIEDNLSRRWEMLQQRYIQIGYWIILSFILHNTDSVIIDCYGTLTDDQGELCFVDSDGKALNNRTAILPAARSWEPITLSLKGTELLLLSGEKEALYLDLSGIKLPDSNPEADDLSETEVYDDAEMPREEPAGERTLTEAVVSEEKEDLPADPGPAEEGAPQEAIEVTDATEMRDETERGDDFEAAAVSEAAASTGKRYEDTLLPGDTVFIGHFPQTVSGKRNEPEPVEWQVYRVSEDGIAWMISKYALERMEFDKQYKAITWEQSMLYKWLNREFYIECFSEKEKRTMVPIDENGSFVTIISNYEADAYLDNPDLRCSAPSQLAKARGARSNKKGFCPYWTRYIDADLEQALMISGSGNYRMQYFYKDFVSVRPVIAVRTEMFGIKN